MERLMRAPLVASLVLNLGALFHASSLSARDAEPVIERRLEASF